LDALTILMTHIGDCTMLSKTFSLKDKVAIVTGAGRGIGRGIALALAEAGSNIAAVARTETEIEEVAREARQMGRGGIAYPTDVTKPDDVDEMVEKVIVDFGKIDILVNNAGTGLHKPVVPVDAFKIRWKDKGEVDPSTRTSDDEWNRIIGLNLTSAFYCVRAVGPHMIRQKKGKVINISSFVGGKGVAYNLSYASSKAALIMFTRSLALEWARYNINVNGIGPGFIHTVLTAHMFEDDNFKKRLLDSIPLKRAGTPEEVGILAVYLSSDASNYITGQTIFIDGGMVV
jgi:NAD(P)-dependent dehydrogenase (short-subunit alcohol dehydrogenase family)